VKVIFKWSYWFFFQNYRWTCSIYWFIAID